MTRVTAYIDASALTENLKCVRQKVPKAKVMAMVKANAYGHGLILCAKALGDADYFGVASLEEGAALREAGIRQPIVLMGGIQNEHDLARLHDLALDTVIYNAYQIDLLKRCPTSHQTQIWLKIDTGMHRLGCALHEAEAFLRRLEALPHVAIRAVMSHLACADVEAHPHTLRQLETFETLTRHWPYPRSILNSSGILFYPEFQYDIVRPGLMLYGASPSAALSVREIGLTPVMELKTSIFGLISVKKGEGVGYGQVWTAHRDSLIATLSIGYGDGYPACPDSALVLIQNQRCPVVGRVSMDLLAVDVTELPPLKPGETVLLWGKDLLANEVARRAKLSVYHLLTAVMERVSRKL